MSVAERSYDLPTGVTIEADLISPLPSASSVTPYRLAVLCHPWSWLGGRKEDPVLHRLVSPFLSRGYHVCLFNARGVGKSTKWPSFSGLTEVEDLKELVKALIEDISEGDRLVKEVVLLGYSHGSIAITHHPVHVKFKGGSNIPVAHILLSYPLSPLPFLTTFHQGTHTEALKNLVSDRNSTVLIIYGTADQFTGEKRFQEWANVLKSQGESVGIQVIEGADHFWHGNAMKTLLESVGAWLDSGERASSS
ncbi:hypothetical protein FRB91_004909 [Serendipita sp. 411]|nr:hypothetical protein FRC18_004989 [Serendipita sp. 400]KAG8841556.1 hypothetical protein FRB91_004909 [Serendipita sp. 411]KAG9020056.1 hypothetical protein FS842_007618 [Serendipita sp. 407]